MKNRTSPVLLILNIVLLGFVMWMTFERNDKIAYVRTVDLFNQFELKKTLSADFQKVENRRKGVLDSLKMRLASIETKLRSSDIKDETTLAAYKENYARYNQLTQQFSNETKQIEERYNEQVWTQLNQYISDFGKEKGYTAVLGAAGNGNIMYANDQNDITEELVEYVNNRLNGL